MSSIRTGQADTRDSTNSVNQSRGTETVTLTRSQLQSILELISQIGGLALNSGHQQATATTTASTSLNPSIAFVEPFRILKDIGVGVNLTQDTREQTKAALESISKQIATQSKEDTPTAITATPTTTTVKATATATTTPSTTTSAASTNNEEPSRVSPNQLAPVIRIRRNPSPCSLPGTPIQLPPPDQMKRASDPFASQIQLQTNNLFPSHSSVPCFRRYQMNQNNEEWEKKRLKMLEYQAMLDAQRLEREQRKKLELERKKREEELWEKKLQEQQERIRREFEDEKRKQREREELIERKRQAVIEAIESKSRQIQSRKPAQADTISLMSVDAVITSKRPDSVHFGDPLKRTQSMYEVHNSSGYTDSEDSNKEQSSSSSREYSDASVQTDYGLLLAWLFDMKEKKDWEEFLGRQSKSPIIVNQGAVDRQREKVLSTSQTLTNSPKTVTSRGDVTPGPTFGGQRGTSTTSSTNTNKLHPYIGPSTSANASNVNTSAQGKSRWHLNKKGELNESKRVADLKRRHIQNSKDFKVKGVTAIKDTKNSLADGGGQKRTQLSDLQVNQVNNNLDYFSIGSKYQLSLSPSTPETSENNSNKLNSKLKGKKFNFNFDDQLDEKNNFHLPAIWDRAKCNLAKNYHKIPITETVIRISSADVTTSDQRNSNGKRKSKRSNLYERKKWQSQENFDLNSIAMDNNDTCFSGDEEVTC